jgi:two-component system nitrogen regulation response regulator GlnG/two-component system response regulator HydG
MTVRDDDLTTAPESDHDPNLADRRRPPVLGLVLLHSLGDPEHHAAFLPVTSGREVLVLGRGGDEGGSSRRATFFRQRPGESVPLAPLRNQALSRAQLELTGAGDGIELRNVGRLPLSVNGEVVPRATVSPGDVIEVGRQLVLLAVSRPPRLHGPSPDPEHGFGGPDRFGFVGESPAAWRLRSEIAFVAPQRGHVLVLGPSGTGKELVASAVHARSERTGPFVARNAATLPESLLDAELFGNPKGYPSPGMPERKGLVGAAHGGTLFLDEIGDLPASAQPHLLRLLDRGEYQRLGESERRVSDLRLIAATNLPESSLRADFLARFDFRIRTPPLADRREDITLLAHHLLAPVLEAANDTARFRTDGGLPRLGTTLVRRLAQHEYSGHVRELRQLLVESVWRSPDDTLEWPASAPAGEASVPGSGAPAPATLDPKTVQAALDECNGSMEKAWRRLGLSSRHALARLVQKHGLVVTRRR